MTDWKKLGKALLFPHIALLILLLPLSVVFLVYSMIYMGDSSPVSIMSYVLSAYTLTVWCLRIPRIIRSFMSFKEENRFMLRWNEDLRLRVNVSLYGAFFYNSAYALLQFGLGFIHSSFWYFSLSGYYFCLALMRFFLLRHTGRFEAGEHMKEELIRKRICGVIFLVMNLALSLMVFYMVYFDRTFIHHEITTIAMAAYTFTSFTFAVINSVKYRKYRSPVYSASKAIGLASAAVSMLTLESTMLTTFGSETTDEFTRKILLGATGAAVCIFILLMAVNLIVSSTREIRKFNESAQRKAKHI